MRKPFSKEHRMNISKCQIGKKKIRRTPWKKIIRNRGDKNHMWKGDKVGYWGIHKWLIKTFGKATHCEQENCSNKSIKFEWAKLKEKEYERKKENFWMLCKSCHSKYDLTDERRKNLSIAVKKLWIQRRQKCTGRKDAKSYGERERRG